MAGSFTVVDLPGLPFPGVIEALDFETILAEALAGLRARDPAFTALVESDPAYKVLEEFAYREVLVRQRVNEAAKAVMLAFATGSDLDQIAANYNVPRLMIDPGDPDALPPVPPTMESDTDFRSRIPMSLEGYTTAGSEGSYVYHALSASGDVKDAAAVMPEPGYVTVYVLSRTGDGTASAGMVEAVAAALNAEHTRPLTDNVTVLSASILPYTIQAELVLYPGPDSAVVLQAAQDAVADYTASVHRIGYDVSLSGLMRALHQTGVQRVILTQPAGDIIVAEGQAGYCAGVSITVGGTDV